MPPHSGAATHQSNPLTFSKWGGRLPDGRSVSGHRQWLQHLALVPSELHVSASRSASFVWSLLDPGCSLSSIAAERWGIAVQTSTSKTGVSLPNSTGMDRLSNLNMSNSYVQLLYDKGMRTTGHRHTCLYTHSTSVY